jgi:transposase, IS5 family
LTQEQKERNREKSRICARVEHVFGFMENSAKGSKGVPLGHMGGCFIRTIGKPRAVAMIGLMNLTYPEGTPSEQLVSSDSNRI